MPFDPQTQLAIAVRKEIERIRLERGAASDALLRYVDTSKADQALLERGKKLSAALQQEKNYWDKQIEIAKKQSEVIKIATDAKRHANEVIQSGLGIGGIGAAITAPLLKFAQDYQTAVGSTEKASKRWEDAMYRFQTSEIKVGRVVQENVVPGLEKAAELSEKIAQWGEAHPEIIQGLLELGGGLTAIGAITVGVGLLEKAVASMVLLAQEGGPGTVGVYGAAVVGGAIAGKGIGNAAARQIYGPGYQDQSFEDLAGTVEKVITISAAGWASLLGGQEKGNETFQSLGKFFGLIQEAAPAVQSAAQALENLNQAAQNSPAKAQLVSAFQQYQEDLKNALDNYNKSILAAQQAAMQAIAAENEKYAQSVSTAVENAQRAQAQADAQYQRQRAQAIADYNKAQERAEEDHKRELEKLESEHNVRLQDLALQRDALGIAEENIAYNKQVQDSNDSYNTEKRRRQEDFQDQLKQMDENYAIQSADRAAALQQQLEQLAEHHREELDTIHRNEQEKLIALRQAYDEQINTLQTAFVDRIRELDGRILADYAAYQAGLQNLADSFYKWLAAFNSNILGQYGNGGGTNENTPVEPPPNAMATGGYAHRRGLYMMGERGREFVMNTPTTRVAERLIGKTGLTQEGLLGALGGRQVAVTIQGDGLSVTQVRQIARAHVDELAGVLLSTFEGD